MHLDETEPIKNIEEILKQLLLGIQISDSRIVYSSLLPIIYAHFCLTQRNKTDIPQAIMDYVTQLHRDMLKLSTKIEGGLQ